MKFAAELNYNSGMINIKNKYFWILLDILLVNLSFLLSLLIRFGAGYTEYFHLYSQNFIVITIIYLFFALTLRLYDNIWRYISIKEIITIGLTMVLTVFSIFVWIQLYRKNVLPRTILFLFSYFMLTFLIGDKLLWRYYYSYKTKMKCSKENAKKRVLIVGAGDAGEVISREIVKRGDLGFLVGFVDDDKEKVGKAVHGKRVLGTTDEIEKIIQKNKVDSIIIAIPSATGKQVRQIVAQISNKEIDIKTLPGLYELVDGRVSYSKIRNLEIEDILGREPINLNREAIADSLINKVVLISGAGGSIGSEIVRQICNFHPQSIILLDSSENNLYNILLEMKEKHSHTNLIPLLLNITNKIKLEDIFQKIKPEVIYHAAAHKHVPILEYYPEEAVWNNIIGTKNLANLAHQYETERFVMISTDKAINPSSVMGASKRIAEMIVSDFGKKSKTKFAAVRFGNVLDSSGSVIPLFRKQITNGGPVTVTDKEVKRYFMTISEASQLVLQAGLYSDRGQVFVLDMGEPINIYYMAEEMIRLMGFEPGKDIDIQLIGLRPGEKLFEELLTKDEKDNMATHTPHKKIFVSKVQEVNREWLYKGISELEKLATEGSGEEIIKKIQEILPNYIPYRDKKLLTEYKW